MTQDNDTLPGIAAPLGWALLILGLSYVQTETKLSDESSDEKKASESVIQPLDCTVLERCEIKEFGFSCFIGSDDNFGQY